MSILTFWALFCIQNFFVGRCPTPRQGSSPGPQDKNPAPPLAGPDRAWSLHSDSLYDAHPCGHTEARIKGCTGRSVYGASRTATTSFFTHYLRRLGPSASPPSEHEPGREAPKSSELAQRLLSGRLMLARSVGRVAYARLLDYWPPRLKVSETKIHSSRGIVSKD